jgi:hypothetical protein
MESDHLSPLPNPLPNHLTEDGRCPIAAPMINTATLIAVRRRRIIAVWADVRV